jgi:hypothetical protein
MAHPHRVAPTILNSFDLGFQSPEEKRFKNTKRGTYNLICVRGSELPMQQISYPRLLVSVTYSCCIETVQISNTRTKANAF